MRHLYALIDQLEKNQALTAFEYEELITKVTSEHLAYLYQKADAVRRKFYATDVYLRGLIEFSNYCKNDCLYCGIRCSNKNAQRYRLSKEEILSCCQTGYELGYRSFVLQSGEDLHFGVDAIAEIVHSIKALFPDCAVTLSVGEHPFESYAKWKEAGADRYLLRHETADSSHYASLHPSNMSFENRIRCLHDLKTLGYQVGCGFMVGSPNQTPSHLAKELLFLKEFEPDMVGIGPFIPQKDTPLGQEPAGTLTQTLLMLSLIRLTLPQVLLPATTALGTIHPMGRELGIKAGANVCMPNLSPVSVRKKYALYDHKICTGDEAAECRECLKNRMNQIGYQVVISRGDRYGISLS